MAKKERIHREYIQLLTTKACPCGSNRKRGSIKLPVYCLGNYIAARFVKIQHFCQQCFPSVITLLLSHKDDCGCSFEFIGRHGTALPNWLTLHPKINDQQLYLALEKASFETM